MMINTRPITTPRLLRLMCLLSLVALCSLAWTANAQDISEADAVALAARHPPLAGWLDPLSGWTAAAYDTGNAYGIWRVQFWNEDGSELGYADVNPAAGRVYTWELYVELSDQQYAAAESVIRTFLNDAPEVTELVENPDQYDIYIDFDSSSGVWGAYIDRGSDSLYVTLDFADDLALTDPQVLKVYFDGVLPYQEWLEASQAKAAAAAFAHPEVAAAVRPHPTWTTTVEQAEGDLWLVTFHDEDRSLVTALVDLAQNTVVEYSLVAL